MVVTRAPKPEAAPPAGPGPLAGTLAELAASAAVARPGGRRRLEQTLSGCRAGIAWLDRELAQGSEGEAAAAVAGSARQVELRSGEDRGHGARVGACCLLLARRLGLDEELVAGISLAAQLHDVGKLGVPAAFLLKAGPLTAAERRLPQEHAEIGHRLLSPARHPILKLAARIAYTHHERYDGSGYPRGLAGPAIPWEGRIAAAADVFDALTSRRPYRPPLSTAQAVAVVRREAGRGLDPDVVEALLASLGELRSLSPA